VKEGTPPSGMWVWWFKTRSLCEHYHIYSRVRRGFSP
jgi:hypothetical protein